ncbi:MAG: tripartite tricarboxylate transporter permease [Gammaproteobacteria bacterium]|nr:tripartite tricarboxylate transporter permease [Gammaproteobacteria bacterium]
MPEFTQALLNLLSLSHLLFLVLGTMLGLLVGILPGLGGTAGLALVLPFVFGMEPSNALAMMIGLLAPTTTSDTFPSVLMGIPGTSGSQATVVDGFPMAKRGEGARALGAAFTASLFGGLFGAVVLTGAVYVAKPLILAVGFGEQMMLILLALTMVGMLTGTHPLKGLATCGIGLMIGMIGYAPATAESRLTFGSIYLDNGIPIVIVGLGMFAMPEIIELLRRHRTIAENGQLGHGWLTGFKDAIKHKFIVLRCSFIGCLVGALPGLGGSVVDWIAYGHVLQTSRNRETFGTGDVRGVLAPESANNAKEGGALIPTLLFGIPGSGSMAILLGGFVMVGISPGLEMVQTEIDLVYTIIWSLALANVIGAGACLALASPIARLTTIPYALLAPIMLVLIFFAAFQASRDWNDLLCLFAIGTLGTYMKRYGWPRPALLIGFFLSPRLESSTYLALEAYGTSFLQRPGVLILLLLVALSAYAAIRFKPSAPSEQEMRGVHGGAGRGGQILFTTLLVVFAATVLVDGIDKKFLARVFPLAISVPTLAALLFIAFRQLRTSGPATVFHDLDHDPQATNHSNIHYLLWIIGMLGATWLIGFPLALTVFILVFTVVKAGGPLWRNALLALGTFGFLGVMAYFLVLKYPDGLLQNVVQMPWWLGG